MKSRQLMIIRMMSRDALSRGFRRGRIVALVEPGVAVWLITPDLWDPELVIVHGRAVTKGRTGDSTA